MKEFTYPVQYTSFGDITVEAENDEEAYKKAKQILTDMHDGGSIANDRQVISWSDDEVELDSIKL